MPVRLREKEPTDKTIVRLLEAHGLRVHGWVIGPSNRAEKWIVEELGEWQTLERDDIERYL